MVQRKLGLQADLPKPSSPSSSHNLQEPNFKKKIKKSRSMKLSHIETLKSSPSSSSSSQKHDSKSKSSSKLPNYMKSTSSSDARKQQQQEQQQQQQPQVSAQIQRSKKRHGSGSCNKETRTRTLTKSSSLRSVRALVKTHSFKHARAPPPKERSRAALRDEIDVERATCSSTLKNSKFPSFLELSHGGTEAQGTSAMRVCPYLYCSLNGHHHNPTPPLKMFLKAKRRSLKTQKSIKKTDQDMSLNVEVYVKNKDFGGQVVEISLSEGSPGSEVDYEEVIEGLAREGAKMGGFCFESDCEDEPEAAIEEGGAISESSGMEWHEVDEEVMSSDQTEDIDDLKLRFSLETENLDFQELDVLVQEVLQEQEVIEDEGQCFDDTELMASPEIECIKLLKSGFSKETENLEIQELDVQVEEVLQKQEVIENEGQSPDDAELMAMLVTSPETEDINHLKDGFSPESENGELETMSKVDVLVQEVLQEQEVIEDEGQSFDDTELMVMLVTSPETEAINHLKDRFSPESENGELETMSKVDVLVQEVIQEQEVVEDESQCFDGMLVTSMEPTPESANLDFHGEFETMSHVDVLVEDVLQELEVMEEGESQPLDDTMLVISAMEPAPEIEGNGVSKVDAQLKDGESDGPVQKVVSEMSDVVAGSNSHADSIADHNADEDSESRINSELKGGFVPKPMKSQEIILEDNLDSDGTVPKVVSEVTDEVAGSNPHADSIADHNVDSDSDSKTSSELKGGFAPKPRKSQETILEDDLDTKWRIGSRRVLEEVKEDASFNPREPNYLPIVPDQESEKVDLKHQMMDERRSDNEWMLDYVLQQTVTKLAPARKRKVALLVEAFESVLPIPRYEPPPRSVFAHARPIQACN